MQKRAEASEAELERERGLHRRELRRRAKELTDIQKELSQVCSQCHSWPELPGKPSCQSGPSGMHLQLAT